MLLAQRSKNFSVFTADVVFALGTPIVCRGLENPDLEGEEGDIRSYDTKSKCYTIHWLDKTLEPCAVKCSDIIVLRCMCLACRGDEKQSCPDGLFGRTCG